MSNNKFLDTMNRIVAALIERGYDPYAQLMGYIMENDSTYITKHNDARQLIVDLDIALVKQYVKLFGYDNVELEFTDEAIETIADICAKRETGARGLRTVVEKFMTKLMFDVPSDKTITKVVITKGCVEGTEAAVITRNETV